jgi:predicted metal-dependent phosphoesterase TrpH
LSNLIYDLHSHSTASDGVLSPWELVERAHNRGVNVLALTDHDTIDGLKEAKKAAESFGLGFVPGVEISVTWQGRLVHVVGLGVDETAHKLKEGLAQLQQTRQQRAEQIGRSLEKAGISGALEGAVKFASGGNPTRTHFARYLVAKGKSRSVANIFKRYLVPGKPGYVKVEWATLEQAVQWIADAGGVAVVAHPGRYKMTATRMRLLLEDFIACGGAGLEVVSGGCGQDVINNYAALAKRFGLKASTGSDFHDPAYGWIDLGRFPPLPAGLAPIWDSFGFNAG